MVLALAVLAGLAVGAVTVAVTGISGILGGSGETPSAKALSSIPPEYLQLYEAAAATCPGLSWTVLAAIGTVESSNGQSSAPGVTSGSNFAGAEGPMQFEPATFASFAVVAPGGADPPTPYDPADAIFTAARLLCADGAGDQAKLPSAVYDYNHSSAYVAQVLSLAGSYGGSSEGGPGAGAYPDQVARAAVTFAEAQIGAPYLWGGTGPGGFDCSGLVQAAYASAGIALPRVAQDQFDAGPRVPPGEPLEPGDLVFFGTSGADVTHVGIYAGQGMMIDAPDTGATVRSEAYDWPDYLGATRPAS